MRLEASSLLIVGFLFSGCSAETKVPTLDPETAVVLQITQPFETESQFEIALSKNARIGFSILVEKLAQEGRAHTEITKTPLGIYAVGNHRFYWRGSILYFKLASGSWVEIRSAALGKMAADLHERPSQPLSELLIPLERLALTNEFEQADDAN